MRREAAAPNDGTLMATLQLQAFLGLAGLSLSRCVEQLRHDWLIIGGINKIGQPRFRLFV